MLRVAHILCLAPKNSAALHRALGLARRVGATLHVGPSGGREGEGQSLTRGQCGPTGGTSVPLRTLDSRLDTIAAVAQYVDEAAIDLVVADSLWGPEEAPGGGGEATPSLVRQLDRPVFVAEAASKDEICDILVPTDLSEAALRAFQHAVGLAEAYDAAVHVLHVVDSLPYVALTPRDRLSLGTTPLPAHRARRRVRAFVRNGTAADVPVHPHLAYGDAAEQIVRFANRDAMDLLVLSPHGSGGPSRGAVGPVAGHVLDEGPGPLFLCRASGASLLPPSQAVR